MLQKYPVPGPKARAVLARDSKVISPSYPRDYPFVMSHGRGSEVWDVDGFRYIDCAAGIAVCSTGHAHPDVVRAIQQQAEKFIHISSDYYHEGMVRVAEKLNEIAPWAEESCVFFTNSGTEAVEAALKLARYYTGRPYLIGFYGGFHGRTYGSVSLSGSKPIQHRGFAPLLNSVIKAPYADPYRPCLNFSAHDETDAVRDYGDACVDYIERVIFGHDVPAEEVAAVLVEPILGEGGYVVPARNFLPRLRHLCDRHGIVLIVDEVQSGVGRTGKWWAVEHFHVEPDIVCSAKGIASGMPFGAMIAREHLMTWKAGAHGNTYGGNPLACAAALETLRLIETGYMDNARKVGEHMLTELRRMQTRHPTIGHVRGLGLMIGVELVQDKTTREPAHGLMEAVLHGAFERGLLLLGCGASVVRFAPPLNIPLHLADEALAIFEDALSEAEMNERARGEEREGRGALSVMR
ncbi:MAG: acetyl ornithine aminotransferase family protein [Anaerolineae bacterium]|nr:acetyl ornithine aminotransferase family protein [Thermoflexales bacterium]MDW8406813.1 acetyl ornithine aminotransferase family protein [Anaerolineae bacterium]